MKKEKDFIKFTLLFCLFAIFNTVYFFIYRASFIIKDGAVTDYYLAALLGIIYGYLPAIAPDIVYNLIIFMIAYITGTILAVLLAEYGLEHNLIIILTCSFVFSGFVVIVGFSHPDILFILALISLAILLFKRKHIIAGVVASMLVVPFVINTLRGNALYSIREWISGIRVREICYLMTPVILLAALIIMRHAHVMKDKWFFILLAILTLYIDIITNYFAFSRYEGDGVNSLYVTKESISGSLMSLADILLRGKNL